MEIPVWEKVALTVEEASKYSGLGRDKIYELAKTYPTKLVLRNGKRILIKRKEFEQFLCGSLYI